MSPTVNSCTKGIWIWKETLKSEAKNMDIIVMDTEGFGAVEES